MPFIETPQDIAEELADALGIYGAVEEHEESCSCRVCFVIEMTERIRQSVENENVISAPFSLHPTIKPYGASRPS